MTFGFSSFNFTGVYFVFVVVLLDIGEVTLSRKTDT